MRFVLCLLLTVVSALCIAEKTKLVPIDVIEAWGYTSVSSAQNSQTILAKKAKHLANGETEQARFDLGRNCFESVDELEHYQATERIAEQRNPVSKDELAHQFVVGMCLYYIYSDHPHLFGDEQHEVSSHYKNFIMQQHGIDVE